MAGMHTSLNSLWRRCDLIVTSRIVLPQDRYLVSFEHLLLVFYTKS